MHSNINNNIDLEKITLIGCYTGPRVKSEVLFSALSKLNKENHMNILTPEQTNSIKKIYEKREIKYKFNSSLGGVFGIYFTVIFNWPNENMYVPDYSLLKNKCCYYFNAKQLLIKIVNEIMNEEISIKNMIYFNIGHIFGVVNSDTIVFELTGGPIENDIDIFLKKIYLYNLKINKRHKLAHPNELIIKWLIPKDAEYGFIQKKRSILNHSNSNNNSNNSNNSNNNNNNNNNPCQYNKQNSLSNENLEKKIGSKTLNTFGNQYIKILSEQNSIIFIKSIQEQYKQLVKDRNTQEKIENLEQLQNMIETVTKNSNILFKNINIYINYSSKLNTDFNNYKDSILNNINISFQTKYKRLNIVYKMKKKVESKIRMFKNIKFDNLESDSFNILQLSYYEILNNIDKKFNEKYIESNNFYNHLKKKYDDTIKEFNEIMNNILIKLNITNMILSDLVPSNIPLPNVLQ
jgi:hypothetical protein